MTAPARRRGSWLQWRHAGAGVLAWAVVTATVALAPTAARSDCVAMAPGFDGVLRLDTGRAGGAPCGGPPRRVYAAVPVGRDVVAAPQPQAPSVTAVPPPEAAVPPAPGHDFARLRDQLNDQTARLQDQLVRLNEETAGLRAETRRLLELLARREPADAPERRGTDNQGARNGPAEAVAPKGDLLKAPAAKDETRAPPGSAPAGKPTDQAEFERRRSVAERAWSELIDLATRMRKDLSGKAE